MSGFAVFLSALAIIHHGRLSEIRKHLAAKTFCLTFHDIVPVRTRSSLWFDCSQSEFTAELNWLVRKGAHFISLDQLYAHLTRGDALPPHPVCLTFADNYLGFYKYAYPILRNRRIPCAMFVHTGFVGSPIGRPKMNWNQLERLDREGWVAVESQTVTHPPDLKKLSSDQLRLEMEGSKKDLEAHLHHSITEIAYPNGKFDSESERAAAIAGYRMGFSEELTPVEKSQSIFAVSRYVHTKFRRAWADANKK